MLISQYRTTYPRPNVSCTLIQLKNILSIQPHIAIETIIAKNRQKMPEKSPLSHPTGIVVDIVGTEETSQVIKCDDGKTACRSLLVTDSLV